MRDEPLTTDMVVRALSSIAGDIRLCNIQSDETAPARISHGANPW